VEILAAAHQHPCATGMVSHFSFVLNVTRFYLG
jgi:hypothetical protein